MRLRQQRGPLEPEGEAQTVVIKARRYLCLGCGAVILVVPKGVVPRRHYSASAIALALCLFGLMGLSRSQVRQKISPWKVIGAAAAAGWTTLSRWIQAIRQGRLFAGIRPSPGTFSQRQVAERAAATACAACVPSIVEQPPRVSAFFGGMRMAQCPLPSARGKKATHLP